MEVYKHLLNIIKNKGAAYLILLDPDKISGEAILSFVSHCEKSGVDGFLIGSSLMMDGDFENALEIVKASTELPVIIFPGNINQISDKADAILYLSVLSGRNAEDLIGKHVQAAPLIKKYGVEPISTGYILIESGITTTAQYISGSMPIPRNKTDIAAATALAAEYLGYKFVYLEAGSGAKEPVPNEMIKTVTEYCSLPVIVGGGIKNPQAAKEKVENGAKIIVTGNYFEDKNNWRLLKEFAKAVHYKTKIEAQSFNN